MVSSKTMSRRRKPSFVCRYCGGGMRCTAEAHAENPFCSGCLKERLEIGVKERGPVEVVVIGDYVWFIPVEVKDQANP